MQKTAWTQDAAGNLKRHGLAGVLWQMWTSRRAARVGATRQMELLETLPLGPKRQLMLVRCGDERFLVGGSLDQVQTIVKLGLNAGLDQQDVLCD